MTKCPCPCAQVNKLLLLSHCFLVIRWKDKDSCHGWTTLMKQERKINKRKTEKNNSRYYGGTRWKLMTNHMARKSFDFTTAKIYEITATDCLHSPEVISEVINEPASLLRWYNNQNIAIETSRCIMSVMQSHIIGHEGHRKKIMSTPVL